MKKMKKVFAMLLAFAMVMGMSLTTFAYDSITININNSGNGTFAKLQLIKADNTKDTGWTFASDAIAEDYTDALGITSEDEVKTPTIAEQQKAIWMLIGYRDFEEDKDYDITLPTGVSPATAGQIADALANVKAGNTFTGHAATVTATEPGVYYIDGQETKYAYSPMAAYVSFNYNADGSYSNTLTCDGVEAKKVPTTLSKEAEDSDKVTEIGQEETYFITSTVPYIPLTDAKREYKFTDSITGATYVTETTGENAGKVIVNVKIGDEINDESATGTTYYGDLAADGKSFVVDLSAVLENNADANKNIKVSYSVVVTDTEVRNNVSAGKFGSSSVVLYTGNITLTKYASDADNTVLTDNKTLAGASFKVYKKVTVDETEVIKWATFDESYKFVAWVDSETAATPVTTGADGTLNVQGLDLGTYYFKETVAPTGYSINEEDAEATLTIINDNPANVAVGTHMVDTTLSALPSTGGIGTAVFTIGGCAIMIAAAYFFFVNRKKEA